MSDSNPNSDVPPRHGPVVEPSGVWGVSAAQLFIEPYCRALSGRAAPGATVESLLEVALRDYRERLLRDLLLTDIECAYRRAGDGAPVADLRTGYEVRFPGDLTVVDDCFRSELVADLDGLDWVEPTADYTPP